MEESIYSSHLDASESMEKKLPALKQKLNILKKRLLTTYKDNIVGIALIPAHPQNPEKQKTNPILIVVDEKDVKNKNEFIIKIEHAIKKIVTAIDETFDPDVLLLAELKELLLDGHYERLTGVALGTIIYDPAEVLAALKVAEVHKQLSLKKFEKYIVSYVIAGSLIRNEKSNDIDVYVVIDDTDVKRMPRFELKDRLTSMIRSYGFQASEITKVKKSFHIQVYILTDFWESIKDANPVIFTFLRDGVPLYDRGVFMPWKLLLRMGKIKPSPEAIDMQMDIGEKLLERVNNRLIAILAEDIYWATLNPAQAALMLYGLPPPTPKETVNLLNEIFVKKEKLLEKKYVDFLEKIRGLYKDIEHYKLNKVAGKDIDQYLKESKDYLARIRILFDQIAKRKGQEDLIDISSACLAITEETLKALNIKDKGDVLQKFKKHLIDNKRLPVRYLNILQQVVKAKEDFKNKKLIKEEAEKLKREARLYIKTLSEFVQRTKGKELSKSRIRFYYDKKHGELIIIKNTAFIIKDSKGKDIIMADYNKDGSLSNPKETTFDNLEESLAKMDDISSIIVTQKLLQSLSKIINSEVNIMIN